MWKFQLACVSSVLVDDFQTRQTIQNHVLQDRDLIPTLQHNLAHSPAPGWFTTLKSGLSPRGERSAINRTKLRVESNGVVYSEVP
jgi:hypothetical protein